MIEVSGLAAHYLNECLHKDNFKQCPRCRQPVATSHYDSHTQSQHCVEVGGEGVGPEVCPLCYSTVPPGDAVREGLNNNLQFIYSPQTVNCDQ